MNMSISIKILNKQVKVDSKHLVDWLHSHKISLIIKNPEMVIFKSKQKKFQGNLK